MRRLLSLLSLSSVLIFSVAARADSFTYAVSGTNYNGTLVLTATNVGSGMYQVTGVTGTLTNFSSVSLDTDFNPSNCTPSFGSPCNANGVPLAGDDVLFPFGSPIFDGDGLLLSLDNYIVNIYNDGGNLAITSYDQSINGTTGQPNGFNTVGTQGITFTAVGATPEPSSIALCGTGLLGIAGAVRRKFKS